MTGLRHRVDVFPDRLRANWLAVRARHGSRLIAVVKGDGYGHGLVTAAAAFRAAGARAFAVSSVEEGVALRESNVSEPVLVLDDLLEDEAEAARAWRLVATVRDVAGVRRRWPGAGPPVQLHLDVDAGLGRGGLRPDAAAGLLAERRDDAVVTGLCAHLASAPSAGEVAAAVEVLRTVAAASRRRLWLHVGGSDCLAQAARLGPCWVRVGRLLYGVLPRPLDGVGPAVLPCCAWRAAWWEQEVGPAIGYGRSAVPAGAAVRVGAGFAAGLPCGAAGTWPVLVGGRPGRVEAVFMGSAVALPAGAPGRLREGPPDDALLLGRDEHGREVPVRRVATALGLPTTAVLTLPRSPRRVLAGDG